MKTQVSHPALLTMLGIVLVICCVTINVILQNGERYNAQYLMVGIPGVILIVWNGPKWLRALRNSGN